MNIYNLDGTDKPIKFVLLVILCTTFGLCWKIQNSLFGGLIFLQLLWPILVITLYEIFLGKGSLLDRFRQTSIGRTSNSYKNHIDDLWYIFFLNIGDIRGLTIIFTVGLSQVERSISTIFDNFYNQTLGRYLDGGRYHVGDQTALRSAGFFADANRVEAEIEEGRQQLREKELAEITARNEARDAELQRQMQMSGAEKMAQKPIGFWDPSAVAFRRQHGISDDIGAGL